jgi:hypothetical protein
MFYNQDVITVNMNPSRTKKRRSNVDEMDMGVKMFGSEPQSGRGFGHVMIRED